MIQKITFGFVLVFIALGCIDKINFDIPVPDRFGLTISGHVEDNSNRHRVTIYSSYDIQAKDSLRVGITAKRVEISDNEGNSVELTQLTSGVYETKLDEFKGKVGGVYKLTVEMQDGRIYESVADTLPPTGKIDSAYYDFVGRASSKGYVYDFVIYAQSSYPYDMRKVHLMWTDKSTYMATTRPLLEDPHCYKLPNGLCNGVHPCTGWLNTGNDFVQVHECECCTCWLEQYGNVILNDRLVSSGGNFPFMQVDRIEQNGWNMMYKMRIEIRMQGISEQAYRFWKSVRDQREGVTNIFQSATGKIPTNIVQLTGHPVPVSGIFYAAASSSKVFYIKRGDNPTNTIPEFVQGDKGYGRYPCFRLPGIAFTSQPDYWQE